MSPRSHRGEILVAEPYADLRLKCAGQELLCFDAGPTSDLVVVSYRCPSGVEVDSIRNAWFAFPQALDLSVHHIIGPDTIATFEAARHPWQVRCAQPLPNGRWILAGSRSRYRGPQDIDCNAYVYSGAGEVITTFTLGDGIQSLQADESGAIWAGYFDEGIFGNLGWNDPLGAPGLLAWDDQGEILYRYSPGSGLGHISDCYAMNVESRRTTWVCYYTDFPLVRIEAGEVTGFWQTPGLGVDCFAVFRDHVLFVGEYGDRAAANIFQLRSDGHLASVARSTIQLPSGAGLESANRVARGSCVYFLDGGQIYKLDLRKLLTAEARGSYRTRSPELSAPGFL